MLRDLNASVDGKRDSTDPRVGVLASEIPSGFSREAFLLNDIDANAPGRLYSLEILTLPSAGVLYLDKAGVGQFTGAPAGVHAGTQRVSKFDPGVGLVSAAQTNYSVTLAAPAATVTGVSVTPTTATGAQQFTAQVLGDNGPSQSVAWSQVGGGTVSPTGYFEPPPPAATEQVIVVTATSAVDPTKSASATITIAAQAPVPVPVPRVLSVTINPPQATLPGGASMQFSAVVTGENNPLQTVTWGTSRGEVDETGLLTAPAATSQMQQGTLTATSVGDPTISTSINFGILPQASDFVPSAARTVRILPGRSAFAVGSHWTLSTAGPVGPKDPNSTIDIPFDWSAWLADIGGAQLAKVEFFLSGGLQEEGVIPSLAGATILVSGGTAKGTATITCRITTATAQARIDDRTVVLQLGEQ